MFPLGSITLPVTFGTEENFRTENVQLDVAKVNLPFNAIIGRCNTSGVWHYLNNAINIK